MVVLVVVVGGGVGVGVVVVFVIVVVVVVVWSCHAVGYFVVGCSACSVLFYVAVVA